MPYDVADLHLDRYAARYAKVLGTRVERAQELLDACRLGSGLSKRAL
ncbi:hypothetical protein [Herbidospora daliensis]|nr:hypothetical protein [Herbidospora daliensis]